MPSSRIVALIFPTPGNSLKADRYGRTCDLRDPQWTEFTRIRDSLHPVYDYCSLWSFWILFCWCEWQDLRQNVSPWNSGSFCQHRFFEYRYIYFVKSTRDLNVAFKKSCLGIDKLRHCLKRLIKLHSVKLISNKIPLLFCNRHQQKLASYIPEDAKNLV